MLRRNTIIYLSIAAVSLLAGGYRAQKEFRECREYVASHAHHETQPAATEQVTQLTFSIDDLCSSGKDPSPLIDRLLGLTFLVSVFVSIGLLIQDLIHWLKRRHSLIGPAGKS
jgi:hypothetical protein